MLTALVDGDQLIYQATSASEVEIDWGEDLWTLHSQLDDVKGIFAGKLERILAATGADEAIIALTDGANWRLDVLPTYKGNRKDVRKPIAYVPTREWVLGEFNTFLRPSLEADDVMGILATHPKLVQGDKIIVSQDKDLKQIPGLYWDSRKLDRKGRAVVEEITEEEGDAWHMVQTLAGDVTDGYLGCPGIGVGTAEKIVDDPRTLYPHTHTFTRGKRKGETENRWVEGDPCSVWEAVVWRFVAACLSEEDALDQARVAKICRREDYDMKSKEVILWTPSN